MKEDLKNDAWEQKWWNTLHEKNCYLNKGTAVLLKETSEFWSKHSFKGISFKKNDVLLDQNITNSTGYTYRLFYGFIIFQD